MANGRIDVTVQNGVGEAIPGAQVYFLTQPADVDALTPLATIYSDITGTPEDNPQDTDGFGHAFAYMDNSQLYTVVTVSQATGTVVYTDQAAMSVGVAVVPFGSITSGTNTTAAMVVGSGATLESSGTGVITPSNITGLVEAGSNIAITGAGTTASPYSVASTGAGTGTVTSVSVGNLAPIFTSSVATSTTTPAVTYTLASPAQNTVLAGPASGGSGSWTARALVAGDLPIATTSSLGAVIPDGTTITIDGTTHKISASIGNTSFSAINGGTNTTSAMVVGTGSSLTPSGSGVIEATVVDTINGRLSAGTNVTLTGLGTSASPYIITASSTAATAWSAITTGTNTAALVVGSGGSITTSGGTIDANSVNGAVVPTSAVLLKSNGSGQLVAATVVESISFVVDGSGSTPTSGKVANVQIPFNCTITGWTVLADVSGSASIGISKGAFASFPTVASIVASLPPTLTTAQKATSTTLTGWTTSITAGDVLVFTLSSVSTLTSINVELQVVRS